MSLESRLISSTTAERFLLIAEFRLESLEFFVGLGKFFLLLLELELVRFSSIFHCFGMLLSLFYLLVASFISQFLFKLGDALPVLVTESLQFFDPWCVFTFNLFLHLFEAVLLGFSLLQLCLQFGLLLRALSLQHFRELGLLSLLSSSEFLL